MLSALADLREKAQARTGLSSFARNCAADPLLEEAEDMAKKRVAFPAQTNLAGAACCKVQMQFAQAVKRLQQNPDTRSLSAQLDTLIFLPLKVFFVLIIVAIGALLVVWRDRIDQHYRELLPRLEPSIIIGAFAMLFWPAMDYGYQQTADVLFGRMGAGMPLRLSLVIAPWVLLLLFYFLRRLGERRAELVGRVSSVVVAAVAVLRLEQLDWVGRLFGIGADMTVFGPAGGACRRRRDCPSPAQARGQIPAIDRAGGLVWCFRNADSLRGWVLLGISETKPHYNYNQLVSFRLANCLATIPANVKAIRKTGH